MGQLHMEPAVVRDLAHRMEYTAGDLYSQGQRLNQAAARLPHIWQGGRSSSHQRDFLRFLRAYDQAVDDLQNLALRVSHEVDQWEMADSSFGESGSTSTGSLPGEVPPPRIYIINGINSSAPDGSPDPYVQRLEYMLEAYGYSPNNVTTLNAIYNTNWVTHFPGISLSGTNYPGWGGIPINLLTGGIAQLINARTGGFGAPSVNLWSRGFNTVVGIGGVVGETFLGRYGPYTHQAYQNVLKDIQTNPLAPGQKMILIGHSGGGAVMANLTPMLEERGIDVEGVLPAGSPLANTAQINDQTRVVNVRADQDVFAMLPIRIDDPLKSHPNIIYKSSGPGGHSESAVSREMINILIEQFPDVARGLNFTPAKL